MKSVSILHECTPTCTFSRKTHFTSIIERENIELNALTFNHDSKNVYYSLNIYCIDFKIKVGNKKEKVTDGLLHEENFVQIRVLSS